MVALLLAGFITSIDRTDVPPIWIGFGEKLLVIVGASVIVAVLAELDDE